MKRKSNEYAVKQGKQVNLSSFGEKFTVKLAPKCKLSNKLTISPIVDMITC